MLEIAKVLKSNGVGGDLLVGFRDISFDEIDLREPVFIEFDGLPVPFFIDSLTPRGTSKAIIHLCDIDNLRDADEVVGRSLSVDYLEFEEEGEDFTGWTVFDFEHELGVVEALEDIPGNPCLVISGKLIPLHEDFIVSTDHDRRILSMQLPEGLADL